MSYFPCSTASATQKNRISMARERCCLTPDGVVGDADGGRIIAIDRYGGLWVAHFFECDAKNCRLFAVQEEGAEFGFGGGCDDES